MTIVNIIMSSAIIAGIVGWIANIVQIVGMVSEPIAALFLLKCVGLFVAPIGSILGIIGMF